jgi:hypothetical protein
MRQPTPDPRIFYPEKEPCSVITILEFLTIISLRMPSARPLLERRTGYFSVMRLRRAEEEAENRR